MDVAIRMKSTGYAKQHSTYGLMHIVRTYLPIITEFVSNESFSKYNGVSIEN